jgi:serine phosphatase RsbU (regulator of sigma subunit)
VTGLRRRCGQGVGGVWLLTAALLGTAAALHVGLVYGLAPPTGPFLLPWWVLAAGFCLAEVAVVHYDFHRETHSFSLSELPLVFGLFFAAPRDVVAAQVAGAAAALLVHRRQTGLKLLFNVGHFALGATLAVVIFRAVSTDIGSFSPSVWAAALLAAVTTSALSTIAIFVAISATEGRAQLRRLPEQLTLALLATSGSASLGLLGTGATWHHPAAGWLLVIPVATFFLAYRAYVVKRQEHDSLGFLYRSAGILDAAPDLATGLSRMLQHACRSLRAEVAQFALLSEPDGPVALLVTATAETVHGSQRVRLDEIDGLLHRAVQSERPQLVTLRPPLPGPAGQPLRQVLLAPLRTETRTLGAVLIGNRLGAGGAFREIDLELSQALARQVAVSLENGRLAQMLAAANRRADQQRRDSLVLQRGLLPPRLPQVPGIAVAVRYVPGAAEAEVGGDWYDLMRLPGGDIGLAIGDVLGHDLRAAAQMSHARSALRAYAAEGHPPASVLTRLNRLLAETDPDFLATCCYVRFSPLRNTVTVASAGHPPPMTVAASGRASLLDVEVDLPLGVDEATRYGEVSVPMPAGSALVLYTDGLVESRATSLDTGLARLLQVPTRALVDDIEVLADRLLAHGPPARTCDDVTLLVLRHQPRTGDPDGGPTGTDRTPRPVDGIPVARRGPDAADDPEIPLPPATDLSAGMASAALSDRRGGGESRRAASPER